GRADGPLLLLRGRSASAGARSAPAGQDPGVECGRRAGIRQNPPRVRAPGDPADPDRGRVVGLPELAREASSQTRPLTVKYAGRQHLDCGEKGGPGWPLSLPVPVSRAAPGAAAAARGSVCMLPPRPTAATTATLKRRTALRTRPQPPL